MSNIFRKSYTLPIPADAELVTIKGAPSARFKHKRRTITVPLTKNGSRVRLCSPCWYGRVGGKVVKLFTDAVASQQKLAELIRDAERNQTGLADPGREQRKRPLDEHVGEWEAAMRNDGAGEKHVRQFVGCVRGTINGCQFTFLADISASRVQQYLADLRQDRHRVTLDPGKAEYKRNELAAILRVKPSAIPSLVRRHRLQAVGEGKARRYPKATAEALCEMRGRGVSVRTSNLHLAAVKAFCHWLVKERRMAESPLDHLEGGNVKLDRRHDRRILDEAELRMVIDMAQKSAIVFRDLGGRDRAMLYQTACTSGFRASELAATCPKDFNLDSEAPEVRLSGTFTKNGKTAVQPLPADVAAALQEYIEGKPANSPLWPGTWHKRAADMLRIDLDACNIPYVIQGGDGPLYADFHCLRHSFVAMLDHCGATLKEAMQLARHSDPKLTMAVYGRARLHDLAGTVDKLPFLGAASAQDQELRATGTDSKSADPSSRLHSACRADETAQENLGQSGTAVQAGVDGAVEEQHIGVEQVGTDLDRVGLDGTIASCRARTYDPLIKSQLLYQLS